MQYSDNFYRTMSLFFFISLTLCAQKITFLQTSDITTVREIEKEIIKNVISSYNRKTKKNFTYDIKYIEPFNKLLEYLKNTKEEVHTIAGINSISVTSDRKRNYDFSSVYLPAFDVVFALKTNRSATEENFMTPGTEISYQIGTTQEVSFQKLTEKFSLKGHPVTKFRDRLSTLNNNIVDYSIGDNVEVWDDNRYKIILIVPNQDLYGFAITYPKGSALREQLDPHLKYYITSSSFYKLIGDKFGKDVVRYLKKNKN